METITNIYDGQKKPLKPLKAGKFELDFIYSQDASVLDNGIRETIKGVKLSIMAMGIALYRINISGLFIDLGYRKFIEYIDKLAGDTGLARTTIFNWEYIGKAYITHRAELDKVGFSDDDGATKLPFLARALEHYPKREVFKNIKAMGKSEFEEWSKGGKVEKDTKYKSIKIRGSNLYVGNSPLVSFADGVSPADRRYYENIIMESAMAVKKNEYARVYRFYDEAEARKFDRVYHRELKALRSKR